MGLHDGGVDGFVQGLVGLSAFFAGGLLGVVILGFRTLGARGGGGIGELLDFRVFHGGLASLAELLHVLRGHAGDLEAAFAFAFALALAFALGGVGLLGFAAGGGVGRDETGRGDQGQEEGELEFHGCDWVWIR